MCTQLAQDAEITTLSPLKNLFQEGDTGHSFYILLSGELQVHIGGETTLSFLEVPTPQCTFLTALVFLVTLGRVLALLGAGASCGELALVADAKRSATVQATKACVLLKISKKSYQRILKGHQVRQRPKCN